MIVGVDVSSHRIDLAWLEHDRPCRWHQELAKGHLIDRLRSIQVRWPNPKPSDLRPSSDVTDIAIEYPFGRSRTSVAALMSVTAIVTRQAPPWARVAWPSAGELRTAIGARNTKASAHEAIIYGGNDYHVWNVTPYLLHEWNEHELDALVACIGWTRILEQQESQ